MDLLFALAVGTFFGVGVFQILRRDLIKAAMGLAIIATSVNLFILSMGAYDGVAPPYTFLAEEVQVSDPLVQALILTAVVVSFGSYALMLAMVNIASRRYETLDSDEVDRMKG